MLSPTKGTDNAPLPVTDIQERMLTPIQGNDSLKSPSIEKRCYLQKQDETKQNKTDLHKV